MPIPLYTICSSSTAWDKDTGRFSIFEVVEKLVVYELPKAPVPGTAVPVANHRMVAVSGWMIDRKAGETFEDDFELSFEARMERGPALLKHEMRFKFESPEKPVYRSSFNLLGPLPFPVLEKGGLLILEFKVRKVGRPAWKSQSYRITVERIRDSDSVTPEDAEA